MKLLIVSCLLIALSSAQTERRNLGENYQVGTKNLYAGKEDAVALNAEEYNTGKTVSDKKREGVWQVVCTSSADCESDDATRGESGFYCDDGVCITCPINGCESSDDPFITDMNACKNDCNAWFSNGKACNANNVHAACAHGAETIGVDESAGNRGWFCNIKEVPTNGLPTGICTRCSFVNTDIRGQTDQCFNIEWEQPNTLVSCSAQCQMYERQQIVPESVDESQIASGLSQLEINYGYDPGFGFDSFCQRFESGWCTEGSTYSFTNEQDLSGTLQQFDNEISQCQYRKCSDLSDEAVTLGQCLIKFQPDYIACTTTKVDREDRPIEVAGVCLDGTCVVVQDSNCPNGFAQTVYDFPDCARTSFGVGSTAGSDSNFQGTLCAVNENKCQGFAQQANQVLCVTESQYGGEAAGANTFAYPVYFNTADPTDPVDFFEVNGKTQSGTCIVGSPDSGFDSCVIKTPGNWIYRMMEITYFVVDPYKVRDTNTQSTILYIKTSTRAFAQTLKCPPSELLMIDGSAPRCFGALECEWYTSENGGFPCGGEYNICTKTTATPTQSPVGTSHGDPIIWTFNDECYDLNMDGKYVASANPQYDHQVNIVVYNDYMREIEVVNKKGKVILSINVDGEYEADDYPYAFEVFEKECPANMKKSECLDSYMSFRFDAQEFQYFVHILRHDYADPSLKEGELGYHLDIYPTPYDRFYQKGHKDAYTGLYFSNPLPEELEYCPGGSDRRFRD